jgi:hypothetical protein
VTGFIAQSVIVSISHCLVTDPTDGYSSSSAPTSSLSGEYPTTLLFAPTVLVITSRHRPHRKHHSCVAVQLLLIKNLLPSSGHCFIVCFLVVTLQHVYMPHYVASCLGFGVVGFRTLTIQSPTSQSLHLYSPPYCLCGTDMAVQSGG